MNNPFAFEAEPFEVYPEFQDEFDPELINPEAEKEFTRIRRIPVRQTGIRPRPSRPIPTSLRRPARPHPVGQPRPIIVRPMPRIIMPWNPLAVDHEPSTNAQEPSGSEHVRWIQHSLNTSMGLNLPVDGVMRIETRRAIGSFQEQQGLSITGIVDPQTEDTLIAMSGNQPPQTGDITTELGLGEELDNFEEEFQVSKDYMVKLIHYSPVRLHNKADIENNLPKKKGLYFIYTGERRNNEPWYIGKAEKSIQDRFQDRFKVFKDFNFSEKCYGKCLEDANVRVGWYEMSTTRDFTPNEAEGLKKKTGGKWMPILTQAKARGMTQKEINAKMEETLLRVLEMYFIKKFNPPANRRDKHDRLVGECVEFQGNSKITIYYPGMVPPTEVVAEKFFCDSKRTTAPKRGTKRK